MKKLTYLLALCVLIAMQSCDSKSSDATNVTTDEVVETTEKSLGVVPPLEGVDVQFATYKVLAEQGKTIETATGTTIIIPKGAFKDANGNPVTGEVEVMYREFHDASAIIASGIPMTNSEGDEYMETAGMFEINGEQNGAAIAVADDKQIEVKMGSFVAGENFDFFHFDKKACNWETKGTAKPEKNIKKQVKLNNLTKVPQKPTKPQKFNEDAFVFDLNVDYSSFPELRAYHGVVWQYNGNDAAKNPETNSWVFKENWKDIELKSVDTKKGKYKLVLSNSEKSFTTDVVPALKGMDFDKAMKLFADKNANYEKMKTTRIEEEERIAQEADLVRTFRVSNFGIFNWDVWKAPNRKRCLASFDFGQETDKYINKISVFLVTGSQRSVVRYYPNTFDKFSFDPNDDNLLIAVLPGNKVAYFKAEDFKNIDLTMLEENKTYTFRMKIEADAVASVGDLASIIERLS